MHTCQLPHYLPYFKKIFSIRRVKGIEGVVIRALIIAAGTFSQGNMCDEILQEIKQ
jgi:hypothetical protein